MGMIKVSRFFVNCCCALVVTLWLVASLVGAFKILTTKFFFFEVCM